MGVEELWPSTAADIELHPTSQLHTGADKVGEEGQKDLRKHSFSQACELKSHGHQQW
jgi:hypothetical protein